MEVMYPYYRLKEAGFDVKVAGSGEKFYKGKYGYPIETNGKIEDFKAKDFDAVIIARFKNRKSMDYFLKKIQTYDFIERTFTKFILHTIKEEPLRID